MANYSSIEIHNLGLYVEKSYRHASLHQANRRVSNERLVK